MSWSTWKSASSLLALTMAIAAPSASLADCEVRKVAELPIVMNGPRPTITVQFNGQNVQMMLDSGAFYSTISSATAAQYSLKVVPLPYNFFLSGIGGYTDAALTTVKDFGLLGSTLHNVEFLVGGSEVGAAGLLGQNLLEKFDVEYDLAHGAVRLFRTKNCAKSLLAYWTTPDKPYTALRIDRIDPDAPYTVGNAYVNDKEIRVMLDTGAATSMLSRSAAERAGVKIGSPDVVEAGFSHGIGRGAVKSYVARFDSFKIGDGEEIKNSRLRIGDFRLSMADMLLGADFFLSHRIFVSNQEHKAYITYNGGPVFDLTRHPKTEAVAASADTPSDSATPPGGAAASEPPTSDAAVPARNADTPNDAAAYARRGSALAARGDLAGALTDLSKACEMSPGDPEYFYRRALVYGQSGATAQALADLDRVIELKEDFLPAYLPRAEIRLRQNDRSGAAADMNHVDRLAPKQADLRFALARAYSSIDKFPESIVQYGLWIESHPADARLGAALGGRCLASALQDQDLPQGLKDCSRAFFRTDRRTPQYGMLYADRGLVYLRQGNYGKAIADFDDALKLDPKAARALYGRAVAESRKNSSEQASSDLAAARAIAPDLPERYKRYGIAP